MSQLEMGNSEIRFTESFEILTNMQICLQKKILGKNDPFKVFKTKFWQAFASYFHLG